MAAPYSTDVEGQKTISTSPSGKGKKFIPIKSRIFGSDLYVPCIITMQYSIDGSGIRLISKQLCGPPQLIVISLK